MVTTRSIEGSMGATRCGRCHRTTEYQVVLERRVLARALSLSRRWLAQCTSCAEETELTATAARVSIRSSTTSCYLRPASAS